MVGRGLLQADNSEEQALAFLQRASLLEPQNPEFAYWEGVGHWANGNQEEERTSYLRGLGADPQSVPLLINLGHNYLSDKNYNEALDAYRAVLALSPGEPVALYNSGLIYRALNQVPEEMNSWRITSCRLVIFFLSNGLTNMRTKKWQNCSVAETWLMYLLSEDITVICMLVACISENFFSSFREMQERWI